MRPRKDHWSHNTTTTTTDFTYRDDDNDKLDKLDKLIHSKSKKKRIEAFLRLIVVAAMSGQSRKWMILVATIWIQAFTGTNFDFSNYSSDLKSVLGISQVQLNYLATASDLGKVFGWSSGLALMYFPLWSVLFMAAGFGFFGYGVQWLAIRNVISLPYILVTSFPSLIFSICLIF